MLVVEQSEPLAFTIDAAASALGISRRTIYRLIDDGTFAVVKAGRRPLIPEADIRAFAARAARKTEAPDTYNQRGGAPAAALSAQSE